MSKIYVHLGLARTHLALPLMLIVLGSACTRVPEFIESDADTAQARSAPLVVVGVADSDVSIGHSVPSRHDPNYPMQLHRATVKIENVLKGLMDEQVISVYYFRFGGGFDGPRPLRFGSEPSRRVLWLRRDQGAFRTSCDGWDRCTILVESGAHPRYRADPKQPLGHALADILLNRGEGEINDFQFAFQMQYFPDQGNEGYVIDKLSQLAQKEFSTVKRSACQLLWIYSKDRIETSLRQRAQTELKAASCNCGLKPDGNVLCPSI